MLLIVEAIESNLSQTSEIEHAPPFARDSHRI